MKRILFAVEDEAMAVLLSEELMEEAYDVAICTDEICLARTIRRTRPDLILMDEEFGGNKKTMLHRIVSRKLKNIPLIVLWRGNTPQCMERGSGVEGFVLTGFNLIKLKQRIATILEGGSSHQSSECGSFGRIPLIQTVFHWVKAV